MSLQSADLKNALHAQAVNNFREYLQIPSVHPNINYDDCIKFLEKQAKSLELPFKVVTVAPGKPVAIITWNGKNKNLPSIMLNSHMDVVPVYEDKWSQRPFGADIVDGKIYGRGSQDMKCVGIWYLEAIRALQSRDVTLARTVHVTFVPDEEIGGKEGMNKFVETKEFRDMNVGFGLDEGMASFDENVILFYDERCTWHVRIACPGISMHGASIDGNTAGEKVTHILSKAYEWRRKEQKRLESPDCWLGDVTSINLTVINGGIQTNVTPAEITLTLDCRVSPKEDFVEFEEIIKSWCSESGEGVQISYLQKNKLAPPTKIDSGNPYWIAFKKATDALNLKLLPMICPGGTDGKYVRAKGIPVLGFLPINNTPILLHQHDEFLGIDTFIRGIDVYCKVIEAIANVEV